MNGQRFPLHRLPNDLCSEVLKTMDHHEIINYSFLSKKATSMVTALQLHISYVVMRMDEPAVIRLQIENRYIEFILEMHRNNKKITNLNELSVSVKMKKVKGTSEFESTLSNQQMFLGDWIKHFFSFSVNLEIDFHVGNTEFDIQAVRNTLPKLQLISLFCSKDEPNENDILNTQYFLRAFLSDAQNLELHSVPLQKNFILQHIGMINLKELQLYYQNNLNFVDVAAWNVESCFITTMDDQVSLRDLNRFFKLWTKESNAKLKEFFVHWNTEIVPDWNVLLKGLKGIVKYALEEEILYIIRNNREISAEIKIDHYDGDKASVVFLLSD